MKHQVLIAALCASLLALIGCERKTVTPSASVGPFNVNTDTGMAAGQAFGIDFKVADASGAQIDFDLDGSPQSSSWAEITLADDLKIGLETLDEGHAVTFQMNSKDLGILKRGDKVVIEADRNVTVNGEERSHSESPE